ncbi:MAG: hypothetical protein JWQ03_2343 [Variovorax sp.]|nr:hypothetical protein [Variovorax sp.]
MKTIEITISPQGHATVLTRGFAGASCREATKSLEQALGLIESDLATAELHQGSEQQMPQSQKS